MSRRAPRSPQTPSTRRRRRRSPTRSLARSNLQAPRPRITTFSPTRNSTRSVIAVAVDVERIGAGYAGRAPARFAAPRNGARRRACWCCDRISRGASPPASSMSGKPSSLQSKVATPPPTMYCHSAGIDAVDAGARGFLDEARDHRRRLGSGSVGATGDSKAQRGKAKRHRTHALSPGVQGDGVGGDAAALLRARLDRGAVVDAAIQSRNAGLVGRRPEACETTAASTRRPDRCRRRRRSCRREGW